MDISKYDNFFFDCDGVIWYFEKPISQAIETLNRLTEEGKRVFFITNHSGETPLSIVDKLSSMEFNTEQSHVVTSASITPYYLKIHYPNAKKIFLIGMPEFRSVLEEAGYTVIHISDFNFQPSEMRDLVQTLEIDREVDCVVVGHDIGFNYMAGMYASMCIQNGAAFIASNTDASFVTETGKIPGDGTFVAFLKTAADKNPESCGKPYKYMFDALKEEFDIDPARSVMIGDTLGSDIVFGDNVKIDTVLVESGRNCTDDIQTQNIEPTYVLPSIASIFS